MTEGPLQIIGPDLLSLKGGMGGTYVKTIGNAGKASVTLSNPRFGDVKIPFDITIR